MLKNIDFDNISIFAFPKCSDSDSHYAFLQRPAKTNVASILIQIVVIYELKGFSEVYNVNGRGKKGSTDSTEGLDILLVDEYAACPKNDFDLAMPKPI